MRKLLFCAALGLLALAVASCETLNIGSGGISRGPQVSVTVAAGDLFGQEQGTFNVSIVGGTAPYTLTYTFSGCVTPLVHTRTTATNTDSLTVTFDDTDADETCTLTVTAVDVQNLTGSAGSATFTVKPTRNAAPTLDATAAGATITAAVTDADNNDVTVSITAPAGFTVAPASANVAGGNGNATFTAGIVDFFSGGTGTFTLTADDGAGGTVTDTVDVTFAPIDLLADTIYAIPLQSTAAVGEAVRIVLATGVPANPFQYQNSVGVSFPEAAGAEYVDDSFDTGAVDGDDNPDEPIDGVWAVMNPADGFLLGPDSFNRGNTSGGLTRFDITVTPNGGSDIQTAGALASFAVTFGAAGTYTPEFVRTSTPDGIDRTYYQDDTQTTNFFWSDDTNADSNAPHTITVQ